MTNEKLSGALRLKNLEKIHSTLSNDSDYKARKSRNCGGYYKSENQDNPEIDSILLLQHFINSVSSGVMPDATALIYLANTFNQLLKGDISSLDAALNLNGRPKVGTPAKVQALADARNKFFYEVAVHQQKFSSIQNDACAAIENQYKEEMNIPDDDFLPFFKGMDLHEIVREYQRYLKWYRDCTGENLIPPKHPKRNASR